MATVSAKVYEHHKKSDGTYNVDIMSMLPPPLDILTPLSRLSSVQLMT